jgi:DNA-binding NarL/FixJ family response regulator
MRGIGEKTAVILDGHPLWVDALSRLLTDLGITVVGTTPSPVEAAALIADHQPALFIADHDALETAEDGLDVLREAASTEADVCCVVLASKDDPRDIGAAFAAGASMYCVKTTAPADLASAIRQMFERSIYHAGPRAQAPDPISSDPDPAPGLTKREIEILQMVAEGYSNAQLAKMLWVTEQTVKFHLSNIYRKLDVANRTEASRWAQLHGLLNESAAETAA